MQARLQELVGALRDAGVAISVAETLDAMQAVAVAGVERERLREALAVTLVKDERDRAVFDDAFERHFPLPSPDDPLRRRRRKRLRAGASGAGEVRGRAAGERGARDERQQASAPAPREQRASASP